jgi:hypothetical protein
MIGLAPLLAALALAQAGGDSVPLPGVPVAALLGGEALPVGGSRLLGWFGYPDLGFLYAQGLGPADAGAEMRLQWNTGEIDAAGFGRLPLWRSGPNALALRARAGLYLATGPSYGIYAHRGDAGFLVVPGLAFSTSAGQATCAFGADLRVVVTSRRGGGSIVAPRLSASIEVPLAGDLTAGARFTASRRWDSRGAPGALRSPEDGLELVALIGYRLF